MIKVFRLLLAGVFLALVTPAYAQTIQVTTITGRFVELGGAAVRVDSAVLEQVFPSGGASQFGYVTRCEYFEPAVEPDECIADDGTFVLRLYTDGAMRGDFRLLISPVNDREHFALIVEFTLRGERELNLGNIRLNRTRRVNLLVGPIPQGEGRVSVAGQISSALPAEDTKTLKVDIVFFVLTPFGQSDEEVLFTHPGIRWERGVRTSEPYLFGSFAAKASDRPTTQYCVRVRVTDPVDRFVVYSQEEVCQSRRPVGYDPPR